MKKSVVSIGECPSYNLEYVEKAVQSVVNDLGGVSAFIKSGDTVLIKPNMLQAKPPEEGITTHPQVLEAVINIVQDAGGVALVGDSHGGAAEGLKRYWDVTGYSEVCNRLDVELVNFEKSGVYIKERNGRKYYIAKPVLDCDCLINLPKLKTHSLTVFTCAIKNMYGSIPGQRKTEYHKLAPKPMNFAELVVDIFALTKPQLNIVDGIVAMQGMGPAAGKPFDLGLILASTDGLALDSYICHMLGKNPLKVPVNKIAYDQGLGEVNIDDIDNLFDMPVIKDFKWPPNIAGTMNRIPEPIMRGLLNLMWTRPVIKEGDCIKCGKCIESCPVNAITDNVVIPDIDYSECINCLCCMEMCPEKAVYLEQSFLEKVISRFA
ncbi:MAG: DUF362 domain-containing protein [Methanobacterium sp.]|jgi:uncharacterized protein (DUF362 family)/NAD-dependent dihydropyrimidine dehydrogenase PreA subunit